MNELLVKPRSFEENEVYRADDMLGQYKKVGDMFYRRMLPDDRWEPCPLSTGMFQKKFMRVEPIKWFEFDLHSTVDDHKISVKIRANTSEHALSFLLGIHKEYEYRK